MKERYNIEISDIQLTIVSDEPEEFVTSTVAKINERVNDLIVHNKRCSKLDAALLCALDYCGEYAKAERRIRNLEAQISLYDANLKRMREELAAKGDAPEAVRSALGIAEDIRTADVEKATKKGAHDKSEKTEPKAENMSMLDDEPKSAPKAAPKAEAPKAEAPKAETPKTEAPKTEAPKAEVPKTEAPKTEAPKEEKSQSSRSKLEQIEMLLRKSND